MTERASDCGIVICLMGIIFIVCTLKLPAAQTVSQQEQYTASHDSSLQDTPTPMAVARPDLIDQPEYGFKYWASDYGLLTLFCVAAAVVTIWVLCHKGYVT